MTSSNNSASQPGQASLIKPMLLGTVVGVLVVSLFLFSSGEGKPEWGTLWKIRPMIVLPLAGAAWGVCYYFLRQNHSRFGVNKTIAVILGVLGLFIAMWMGVVVGFDGTLWD